MKLKKSQFSRLYQAELQRHLKIGPGASLKPAMKLGRLAVSEGLDTLDLALIHERALISQVIPGGVSPIRAEMIRRATKFFAEVIVPLEETHRTAMETAAELGKLNQSLTRRSVDLAASNRLLKKEIVRRLAAENLLRKSEAESNRLMTESRRQQEELRLLSRRVLSVQEEERKRISRELHDVIAQMLTGINVRLAMLKTETASDSVSLRKKISKTQRLVEKSVDIVHRFARELRPAVLDDLGLIPALHTFTRSFSKKAGIPVKLTASAGVEKLSSAKRTALYRVAHEALTNVARHARAGQVEVNILKLPGAIRMEIRDDGKGFDLNQILADRKRKRLGLLGIRERVEMIGGNFAIDSAPRKGTTLRVQIPFHAESESISS